MTEPRRAEEGGRARILAEVSAERDRQEGFVASGRFAATCASPEMFDGERLAVLMEEVGEAARCVLEKGELANDKHGKHLREELVRVAAVAVAWVEGLDAEPPPDPARTREVLRHAAAQAAQTRALVAALEEACAWADNFPFCDNDWRGEEHDACLQQLDVYKAEVMRKARDWRAALAAAPREAP